MHRHKHRHRHMHMHVHVHVWAWLELRAGTAVYAASFGFTYLSGKLTISCVF